MGRPKTSPLSLSARAAQLLLVPGAPLIFLHCVDYVVETSSISQSRRDLVNADLFSGEGAVNRAFVEDGLGSKPFDKATSGQFGDICTTPGFLRSVQLILQTEPGGLATAGPPCGSFIYLNLFTSQRSKSRPLGGRRAYVQEANKITARLCLLLLLAFVRCVLVLIEQPISSLMPLFPYMRWLAKIIGNAFPWLTTKFHMASYGHPNMKPTQVFGTAPWSYKLRKKITKAVRRRVQKSKKMVRKYIDKQGRQRVCGNTRQLKRSQVYPIGYGRAIRSLHMAWKERPGNLKAFCEILYPPQGGLNEVLVQKATKAPFRWRHACLSELQDFLISEKKAGRYHPVISGGLDYN